MARRQSDSIRRILILSPSLQSPGGVQTYTRQLIEGFSAVAGAENVRCVSLSEEPAGRADGSAKLGARAKLSFVARSAAAALRFRPDVIICMHVGLAPIARLIGAFAKSPYWLALHGIEVWGPLPAPKLRAMADASRWIVLTRFTLAATLARHPLGEHSALVLPPYFRAPRSQNQLPSEPVSHIVLTVGRLSASERYKGHDAMLEAWPQVVGHVPDAVYWIVGDGDDRARLEEKAARLGVDGSVKFYGNLSGTSLQACYQRCSIFAMPAASAPAANPPRGEVFGIVYVEAMAQGKPVIAGTAGAPAEFIRDGEFGTLVNSGSVREITAALVSLLADPQQARAMGAAGRAWVESELSFERFCDRLRRALTPNSGGAE